MWLPATLLSLALLASCAAQSPPLVENVRHVAAPPVTVRERMDHAVNGYGFVPGSDSPDAPFVLASGVPAEWAECGNVLISGPSEGSQRDWAPPLERSGEVRLKTTPDNGGTRAEVFASFRASYLHRYRGTSFKAACRSTGVLEHDILDAGATSG